MALQIDGDDFDPTCLKELIEGDHRWIFVGGKGGVGKTTTSCSIAAQLASHREKVLLISTDPAHNISDAFAQKFSSTPTLVSGFENLFAMEIDTNLNTSDTLEGLSDEKGFLNDIISSVPGIDEAMCFAELMKQVQNLSYSCVVFDTAPTGHTLRLLSFPTVLEKAFAKLNTIKDKFGGMMQGMSSMMGQGNEENILEKLEEMQVNVRKIRENFENPDFTTFVCVCIPEFLSLFETERLVQELGNYSIDVSNIVVNQVLFPDECSDCRKCKARTKMQKKYLDQIDLLYDGFSVVKMPLLDQEVRSKDSLLKFGDMLRTGVADSRALPETD